LLNRDENGHREREDDAVREGARKYGAILTFEIGD
jgi:hypothetical protein